MTILAHDQQPIEPKWADITARAPVFAATSRSYLDQISVSARPGTVAVKRAAASQR
jgi:hypothetical protein